MKIRTDEFRIDAARPVETPLDFTTLCAALAASQAATPTARLANDALTPAEPGDRANAAVAVLLADAGSKAAASVMQGSFHPAAAAHVNDSLL